MPAEVKYSLVDGLKEKLSRTKAVFVAEYRGMTVAQSTMLRHKVREAGGELKVAKNTLFAIAMKEAGLAALPEDMMTGPNIYALCYDDPVAVAKVLKEYANDKTQKAFILKGGQLEAEIADCARRCRIDPQKFFQVQISNWFRDPWFEGKKIVIISK